MQLAEGWNAWATRAVECVLANATFPTEESETVELMQTTGGRLSVAERMARPHRPREWLDEMGAGLDDVPAEVADRVRSLLRSWLTGRINRIANVYVIMGMMLRDVLNSCTLHDVPHHSEAEAQRRATDIQQKLEEWLDRNHRMEHFPRQPALLHQALLLAVQMDELDFDQIREPDQDTQWRETEEMHLMFRINNLVQARLPPEGRERSRRIGLLEQALRNQVGSESRHLRRLGIALMVFKWWD